MNRLLLFIFFVVCIGSDVLSNEYKPYEWEAKRNQYELSEEENNYGLYYLKKVEKYQFVYNEEGRLFCYVTHHNILRVNNDEALNNSNQIYISMRNALELTDLKARVLTADGREIEFDSDNIKELESDDAGFKIFAVEGAEVGSEIEYFYTKKTYGSSFMTRFLQFQFPVKSYQFSLTCPDNLEYDFKVYNRDVEINQVDESDDFNQYEFSTTNIPPLFEESFSAYENSKARLEFKLAYNTESSKKRINTWGYAGVRIYEQIYTLNNDEEKAFSKFLKDLDLKGEPLEAFRRSEHYIKTNFFYEERAGDAGNLLDQIIKNRYATSRGFTKLYGALLNHLNIAHEIVLASDRYERAFDADFDTWNYLDEYLIYLNDSKQFLSPKDTQFRLGTIDDSYIGSYALFVKPELVQDYLYPVAHIDYIPAPSYKKNSDDLDINVSFSDDLEKNSIEVVRTYKGYSNQYYKMAMIMLEEERKEQVLDDVLKYLAPDAEIENVEVLEKEYNYKTWDNPFRVKGTFTTSNYIESAGDIILFKAGELIGPQSELYQEDERTSDVVNTHNRGYIRKIIINLPKGMTVQNPDDLIIDEQVEENGKVIYKFLSSYVQNGNKLTIDIEEYYDELYYPKEKFEEFRRVINAAADFNKIVLVLE